METKSWNTSEEKRWFEWQVSNLYGSDVKSSHPTFKLNNKCPSQVVLFASVENFCLRSCFLWLFGFCCCYEWRVLWISWLQMEKRVGREDRSEAQVNSEYLSPDPLPLDANGTASTDVSGYYVTLRETFHFLLLTNMAQWWPHLIRFSCGANL